MTKAPSVFLFGDDSYEELDKTKQWTIDVLGAEAGDARDLKDSFDVQEQQLLEWLGLHDFKTRQERKIVEKLYQGNDFDNAFIGLITSNSRVEKNSVCGFKWDRYSIELQKCQPSQFPGSPYVEAPVDIAELTRKQPWEYEVLSYDESEYSDTATPMSLTFHPMSTLGMTDKFLPGSGDQRLVKTEAEEEYTMCILSVPADPISRSQCDEILVEDLRERIGLQDGVEGLQELRVLRKIAHKDGTETVCFLCGTYICSVF